MNVITAFESVPHGNSSGMSVNEVRHAPRGNATVFTLRQSGGRPISFSGALLGHHNGYRVGTSLWHELNLFQTEDGHFVADIHIYTKAQGSGDQFRVHVAESLDEAVSYFENYDPRMDVIADFNLLDDSLSPAEVLVHGSALKYQVADTVAQYRSALGSFLKQLNGD